VTEEMVGGQHRNDEATQSRAPGWTQCRLAIAVTMN